MTNKRSFEADYVQLQLLNHRYKEQANTHKWRAWFFVASRFSNEERTYVSSPLPSLANCSYSRKNRLAYTTIPKRVVKLLKSKV